MSTKTGLLWAGLLWWAALPGASAETISLPQTIVACLDAGECSVASDSSFESNGIAAFRYVGNDFEGYLFRYSLIMPSQAVDIQEGIDFGAEPPVPWRQENRTGLGGSVWLGVASHYSQANGNGTVNLYLDRATPAGLLPLPRYDNPESWPQVLHFGLNGNDLITGRAFRELQLISEGSIQSGELFPYEPLLPCLADGCSLSQEISLIGMRFTAEGGSWSLQFAPNDRRNLLYSEALAYSGHLDGFRSQRQLYVQPIPLPAGIYFWLSGLWFLFRWLPARKAIIVHIG